MGDGADGQHRDERGVHRYAAGSEEELSTQIVLAVADVTGEEMTALPPLMSTVDPGALDTLFVSDQPGVRIEFEYAGCEVVVDRGREILVIESP